MNADMTRAQVLAYVEDHSGQTRDQIAAALKTAPVETSNALAFWKDQGALHCTFKGRYSTWSADKPKKKAICNSVFTLGQCI